MLINWVCKNIDQKLVLMKFKENISSFEAFTEAMFQVKVFWVVMLL